MNILLYICGTTAIIYLAACIFSVDSQPPAYIMEAHAKYASNPYKEDYSSSNMKELSYGEAGNCARFASSYMGYLNDRGHVAKLKWCNLRNGKQHMFVMSEGWALDNRFKMPVRENEVGCVGKIHPEGE